MSNTIEVQNQEIYRRDQLPQVLTVGEASRLLRLSGKAVRTAFEKGEIPGGRRVGGHFRFHRDRLLQWLDEGEACKAPPESVEVELHDDLPHVSNEAASEGASTSEPCALNPQTVAEMTAELAHLNRILRYVCGARAKVTCTYETDDNDGVWYVRWGHLARTPREAMTRAVREYTCNVAFLPDACCINLEAALVFLQGVRPLVG